MRATRLCVCPKDEYKYYFESDFFYHKINKKAIINDMQNFNQAI